MANGSFSIDVNPAVLRWARQAAGREVDGVAERFKISKDVLDAWEAGKKSPTWKDLRQLAKFYQRPLAALLLPAPPRTPENPTDFRKIPDAQRTLSAKTLLALRTARWLQARAVEMQRELQQESQFSGRKLSVADDVEKAALECRSTLGIDLNAQVSWGSAGEAYRHWKESLSTLGVLVFQFAIPRDEAQGFSLFDPVCPVIVVSESDFPNARIFTLFHEYAHLLLRESGLCLPFYANSAGGGIEPFCNRFAASVLIPESEARSWRIAQPRSANATDQVFKELADHYRVSRYVVLIRMKSVGGITEEVFDRIYGRWQSQGDLLASRPKKPASGGASAVDKCIRQRGKPFIVLVTEATRRGLITTKDAMTYLGVRLKDFGQLESRR
jgi:Zn-dependent peptidase ImmA (M78 family)